MKQAARGGTANNEHDVQSGTVYFERHGDSTSMAAYIKQPAEKTVFFNGSTLTLLQPDIKQETLFSAGSNRGQYESFLTLGFGGSGKADRQVLQLGCQNPSAPDDTALGR
jgi:outer membrane lipoprotein-sorting protein